MATPDYGSFHDDVELITDDDVLFRRIVSKFVQWGRVTGNNKPDVPSQGFQDYPERVAQEKFNLPGACMSVSVERILADHGYDASKLIEDYPGYGVAATTAGAMRALEGSPDTNWAQGVMLNSIDAEPWHAVVYCKNGGKKSAGMQNAIRLGAMWVILPAPPQ
jgi:hypothetical protein